MYVDISVSVLALLVMMMSRLYMLVLLELVLQCHQIFSLIFVIFPMALLECLILFSYFLDCTGECCGYFLFVSIGFSVGILQYLG